ncbi:UNVERIFIED_CONTAM: hypothetical protein GTU68_022323 [Idotea baltica]|nr:hypothetical protein [Idotea baltica]
MLVGIWFVGSQPLLFTPEKVSSPEVSSKSLEENVRLLSETLPKRLGTENNLNPTVQWIEKKLKPFANKPHQKSYRQSYKVENETFHNIFIEFVADLKHEPDEIIIIGAHYDTAHGFAGADDNASGVAALIELAKHLSENREKLLHKVVLAFYPLEEPPYFRTDKMGSFIHASSLKEKQQKVKMMISLDMIGYFSDEENSQNLPFPLMDKIYPTQGNFIAIVANISNMMSVRKVKKTFKSATQLPVYSFNAPALVQGIDFSDHLNFWHHDYPAVLITDTSFNRNKHYHTVHDTAEKLDYVKMAEVVKALYQTAVQLGGQ